MHIASKITLLIGAIMLIGGVIGTIGGVAEFGDTVEGQTYIKGESSGTFTINENQSWDIAVYLIHPVDCQSVELTIVDSFGTDVIEDNWNYGCSDNEMTFEDGEMELYGYILHEKAGMEYTLNSNVDVDISGDYCDEACSNALVDGGLSVLGICCSIPLLIIGLILAFTLDNDKTSSTMQSVQMATGQVAYQTPVSGQVAYQTPVSGQVMYQTPIAGQSPMTQTFNQTPVGQVIQPSAVPVTPITPPLTQQPPVEQASQPAAVPVTQAAPVTPITPPTTQQPSVGQDTQPEQTPWWGDEPQQ